MSALTYARGRPVYSGGTFVPNVGAVSPQGAQGYLQREVRNQNQGPFGGVSKVGSDGKSDTRSGVAQSALARQQQVSRPATSGPKPPSYAGSGGPKIPDTTPVTPPHGVPPVSNGNGGPSMPNQPVPAPAPPPQVIVGANGQLELPMNQQFGADVLAALDQYNNDLIGLQFDQQSNTMDYQKNRRDAGIQYDDTKRATLSGNAARGTAFSSQYGVAVGKNARDYQNKVNDLDSKYNLFNQMSELKRAGIITAFQRMLAQAAMANADAQAENAGNLGLGGSGGSGNGSGGGSNGHPGPNTGGPKIPDTVHITPPVVHNPNQPIKFPPPKKK